MYRNQFSFVAFTKIYSCVVYNKYNQRRYSLVFAFFFVVVILPFSTRIEHVFKWEQILLRQFCVYPFPVYVSFVPKLKYFFYYFSRVVRFCFLVLWCLFRFFFLIHNFCVSWFIIYVNFCFVIIMLFFSSRLKSYQIYKIFLSEIYWFSGL